MKNNNVKIVAIGDSITFGYPYTPNFSWFNLAANKLNFDYVNKGINGDTTDSMLSRFYRDVLRCKPSHVIIMGGANDAYAGITADQVMNNIRDMTELALKKGIVPIIGLPIPCNDLAEEQLLGQYREKMLQYIEESNIEVIDFHEAMVEENGINIKASLNSDDVHPSKAGYEAMAGVATEILRQFMQPKLGIILKNIKDNWAIYGFIISSFAYVLGYFKAAFFLWEFKVIVSPIDVYPALSLFVSGITTIVTGLIVPVINILVGWIICWFRTSSYSESNWLILFSTLLTLSGEIFLMFISRLPGSIYVIPFFFSIFGQDSWKEVAILSVLMSGQIIVSYYAFRRNAKLWMTSVALWVSLWFGLFVYAQIATFPKLNYIPVGAVQQSGMRGIISTELPISQQSKKIEKFSKVYFETHGMLLNRYDQTRVLINHLYP